MIDKKPYWIVHKDVTLPLPLVEVMRDWVLNGPDSLMDDRKGATKRALAVVKARKVLDLKEPEHVVRFLEALEAEYWKSETRVIYKYTLDITDRQLVTMCEDRRFLRLETQGDVICAWYSVQPESDPVVLAVTIYGTGQRYEDIGQKHLGTVLTHDGLYVWHVFTTQFMDHGPDEMQGN